MNTTKRLALNCALFAFLIPGLAIFTQAQNISGANSSLQEAIQESPDRQLPGGADTTQRLRFWNEIALKANGRDHARLAPLRPDQPGPVRTARAFAIVHIAIFDAYNAIVGGFESYTGFRPILSDTSSTNLVEGDIDVDGTRRRASVDAAIIEAAAITLKALYPSQATDIENVRRVDLGSIPASTAKNNGIIIGRQAANAILSRRSNDGSNHPEPEFAVDLNGDGVVYTPNPAFGKWRRDPVSTTPQNPGLALGALWGRLVRPFVILSAGQFRPVSPPALSSAAYAAAFNEVKRLGGDGVTTPTARTADQTIAGIYWGYDGTPFVGTPNRLYNQITVQIAQQMGTSGIRLARLLALVNVAMADAGLVCWEAKYREEFWRPVTGIRAGNIDSNLNTIGDPNFVPLGSPASNTNGPNFTPPFPAYTSGHATFGGALFQVMRRFYLTDGIAFNFISDEFNGITRDIQGRVRPLVLRHFASLTAAEEENGQSRIYLGVHWSFDKTEGIKQGRRVGDFIFNNSFRRLTFGGVLTSDDTN
ncbi:MAG TPA: chloroperoxidase [Blastocatellia bacterium]|nr:chloroperoxidase [Blastocatellia bacterium]